jgi:uncharacterized membrane protein
MRWAAPTLLVAAVALANLPLVLHGYGAGHDAALELTRVAEYRHALAIGEHPPFWAPDLYGGFGSPIFLYYAPLFAFSSAALSAFVSSEAVASIIVLIAFTAIGAMLMGRFVLEVDPQNRAGAVVATVLFALQPYLLADKWLRNANAEFIALAILPGIFIGAVTRKPRRAFAATFASLAAIILAHNITALIATSLAIGIAVVVHRSVRATLPVLGGIVAAIAVTAFFWLPAFRLQPLVRPEELLTGKFDFHVQFPALRELFGTSAFFAAGPLCGLLFVLVAVALTRFDLGDARRVTAALFIAAVVTLLLALRLSTPVWEHLPLLRFAQFPWRLAGPFAIAIAAAAGVVTSRKVSLAIALVALAILSAIPSLIAYRPLAAQPHTYGEIAARRLRVTVYDEYLPRTADERLIATGSGPVLSAGPGATVSARNDGANVHARVLAANDTLIVFRRWFFPVWSASVDSRHVPIIAARGGAAAVRVPSGNHDVRLELVEPVERVAGKAISGCALAILLAGALLARRLNRPEARGM